MASEAFSYSAWQRKPFGRQITKWLAKVEGALTSGCESCFFFFFLTQAEYLRSILTLNLIFNRHNLKAKAQSFPTCRFVYFSKRIVHEYRASLVQRGVASADASKSVGAHGAEAAKLWQPSRNTTATGVMFPPGTSLSARFPRLIQLRYFLAMNFRCCLVSQRLRHAWLGCFTGLSCWERMFHWWRALSENRHRETNLCKAACASPPPPSTQLSRRQNSPDNRSCTQRGNPRLLCRGRKRSVNVSFPLSHPALYSP